RKQRVNGSTALWPGHAAGADQAGSAGGAAVAPVLFFAEFQIALMAARWSSSFDSAAFSLACALARAAGNAACSTASMSVCASLESNDQVMTSLSAVSRLNAASDSVTW